MAKQAPLYSGADPATVAADLAPLVEFTEQGLSPHALRQLVEERLLPHLMQYGRPQFQSMFNAFPSAEAQYGAEVALQYNQGVTNWQVSPGGAVLEEMAGRALCRLFNLDETADATFMYSGTYANQEAVYLALHRHAERQGFDLGEQGLAGFADPARLAILVSADAHFSLRHAARMLGLGQKALVALPVDRERRIDVREARQLVREIKSERDIFCLVATTGTTSTGSVDPVHPLATLAAELGAWFHLDGAYGYAYKLVPECAPLFGGDDLADSITWDPHKQLSVPIPNSLLFVRDWRDFGRMSLYSGYFNRREDVEPNPGLKSPPTTRPFSALPLVTALRGMGLRAVRSELRAHVTAIQELAAHLAIQPDVRLLHRPDTGILCFQMVPDGLAPEERSALQRRLYEQVMASGQRSISTTTLHGETVLRLLAVSSKVTTADLLETISFLRQLLTAES